MTPAGECSEAASATNSITEYLLIYQTAICNGTQIIPTILTSEHDDLFGERIAGSTGNPTPGAYSGPAISLYYPTSPASLTGLRIRNAGTGVTIYSGMSSPHSLSQTSLEKCTTGISVTSATLNITSASSFRCNVTTPMAGSIINGSLTADCQGDQDSDGLPDTWEIAHFGNLNQNAVDNPDTDGLSNAEEYSLGTNPNTGGDNVTLIAEDGYATTPGTVPNTAYVGIENKYNAVFKLNNNPISAFKNKWVIGGSKIKTYYHDIDEANAGPNHQHLPIQLTATDFASPSISFLWKTSQSVAAILRASKMYYHRTFSLPSQANPAINVLRLTDESRNIYTHITAPINVLHDTHVANNIGSIDPRRNPNGGPNESYRSLLDHARWHRRDLGVEPSVPGGDIMLDGELPIPIYLSGNPLVYTDPNGLESFWGDPGAGLVTHNGSAFLRWHKGYLDAHFAWRQTFNIPSPGLLPTSPLHPGFNERHLKVPE